MRNTKNEIMENIKSLDEQILGLKKAIKDNLTKLVEQLNFVSSQGGIINPNWSVTPPNVVDIKIIQNIEILGPKTEDYIKEKENVERIFLKAVSRKIEELLNKAKGLGLDDFVIDILKKNVGQTLKVNVFAAVNDLNESITQIEEKLRN